MASFVHSRNERSKTTRQADRPSCDPLRRAGFLGLLPHSAPRDPNSRGSSICAVESGSPPPLAALQKSRETFWSARVGLHYRALAVEVQNGVLWFWVGTHAEYDRLVG